MEPLAPYFFGDVMVIPSAYFSAMKAATSADIKKELKSRDHSELIELCLRLARFKKENKELLSFLLFEENDLAAYINSVKEEMDEGFGQLNLNSIYFAKKSLRKLLRIANKYIRYTGNKEAEAEILLHYATSFKGLKLSWQKSAAMVNIYNGVMKKISAAIDTMHEDLQHDYRKAYERLVI